MIDIAKKMGISIADETNVTNIVQQYKHYFPSDNNVPAMMKLKGINFERNLTNYDEPTRYWSAIALCRTALPQKIQTISAHFDIPDKTLKNAKNMVRTIRSCHGMVPEEFDRVARVWKQTRQSKTTSTPSNRPLIPIPLHSHRPATQQQKPTKKQPKECGRNAEQRIVTTDARDNTSIHPIKPNGLIPSLYEHQAKAVGWMYARETGNSTPHGGILADDMGLGEYILHN